MRHVPFLKALAKTKDAADPVWRDVAPGYLVLRFFDRWLEEGPAAMAADPVLPALKARIRGAGFASPEVRKILLHVIDALVSAVELDPRDAIEPLFEYAEYLRVHGSAHLAGHTYGMVAESLEQLEMIEAPQLVTALIQQGLNARIEGDYDIARTAYRHAEFFARRQGNQEQGWFAKIGLANILRAQGNLPGAEELATTVIEEARGVGNVRMEAYGYNARAAIFHLRGRYDDAMREYYRAYEKLTGPDRERILGDLAVCETDAGYRDAARDTHRLLAYTAQFDVVRGAALVNLIELAVLDNDEAAFNRARLDFTAHEQRHHVPVEHQAHAALYTAMGVERFASLDSALDAYRVTIAKARSAKIHQIEFEAERRLEDLRNRQSQPQGVAPMSPPSAAIPPAELRYITETIAAAASSALATMGL